MPVFLHLNLSDYPHFLRNRQGRGNEDCRCRSRTLWKSCSPLLRRHEIVSRFSCPDISREEGKVLPAASHRAGEGFSGRIGMGWKEESHCAIITSALWRRHSKETHCPFSNLTILWRLSFANLNQMQESLRIAWKMLPPVPASRPSPCCLSLRGSAQGENRLHVPFRSQRFRWGEGESDHDTFLYPGSLCVCFPGRFTHGSRRRDRNPNDDTVMKVPSTPGIWSSVRIFMSVGKPWRFSEQSHSVRSDRRLCRGTGRIVFQRNRTGTPPNLMHAMCAPDQRNDHG